MHISCVGLCVHGFMNPMPSWFVCGFFFSDVLAYCVMLQAFICYCSFVRCFWRTRARARACVCVIHWHCTAQLSMFNMEKRFRNKIIIIIIIISFPRVLHGAGTHRSTCAFRCHRDIAMDDRTSTCLGTCDRVSLHKQPFCLYFAHRYNLRPLFSLGVWHQQCISTWRWDWVNVVLTTASIEILWSISGIAWRRYRRK